MYKSRLSTLGILGIIIFFGVIGCSSYYVLSGGIKNKVINTNDATEISGNTKISPINILNDISIHPTTSDSSCLSNTNAAYRPQPTPLPLPVSSDSMYVKLFYISVSDNGKFGPVVGCGDSLISFPIKIKKTQAVLRASIDELIKEKLICIDKQLYNPLYQSDLSVNSISLVSGKAIIKLTGSLLSGGLCDNPRIKAQIEATALQFPTVKSVEIIINDVNIDSLFSGKG
jgi:hypothetical protein